MRSRPASSKWRPQFPPPFGATWRSPALLFDSPSPLQDVSIISISVVLYKFRRAFPWSPVCNSVAPRLFLLRPFVSFGRAFFTRSRRVLYFSRQPPSYQSRPSRPPVVRRFFPRPFFDFFFLGRQVMGLSRSFFPSGDGAGRFGKEHDPEKWETFFRIMTHRPFPSF